MASRIVARAYRGKIEAKKGLAKHSYRCNNEASNVALQAIPYLQRTGGVAYDGGKRTIGWGRSNLKEWLGGI